MKSVKTQVKERKQAHRKAKYIMNTEDLMKYKRKKAIAQRAIKKQMKLVKVL